MAAARDGKGRFQIGHAGGPGRPKRSTEAGYLSVLMEECGPEQWRSVVRRAVTDAADGNEKARAWLSSYLLGTPSATAPAPVDVVVAQMLGTDPALDLAAARLAKPEVDRSRFPGLMDDDERERAILADAAAVILDAEQARLSSTS